jgi:hypothetical protein
MKADDVLRVRRLSKRVKLLSGIEPRSIGKEQAGELMLMILEAAEEIERITDKAVKNMSEGS